MLANECVLITVTLKVTIVSLKYCIKILSSVCPVLIMMKLQTTATYEPQVSIINWMC